MEGGAAESQRRGVDESDRTSGVEEKQGSGRRRADTDAGPRRASDRLRREGREDEHDMIGRGEAGEGGGCWQSLSW